MKTRSRHRRAVFKTYLIEYDLSKSTSTTRVRLMRIISKLKEKGVLMRGTASVLYVNDKNTAREIASVITNLGGTAKVWQAKSI